MCTRSRAIELTLGREKKMLGYYRFIVDYTSFSGKGRGDFQDSRSVVSTRVPRSMISILYISYQLYPNMYLFLFLETW
jgi:hypothetical protein